MFFKTKKQKEKLAQDLAEMVHKKGQMGDIWRRMLRNRLGMVGLTIVALLLFLVIFAPLLTKYPYDLQQFDNRWEFPSGQFWLGTDNFGRDLWARMLYGGRVSLLISFMAVCIANGVGACLGAIAGYFGGKVDIGIMRVLDVWMAIPGLLLAMSLAAALGTGPQNTALAISISGIPYGSRIIRSTVMAIKSNEFVEAARATGSKNLRIIFRHIIPNAMAPLMVSATLSIGGNIMAITGLSFLGLGVKPPNPEWGSILAAGRTYLREYYHIVLFPALFIMLTLFGFNLFGDGLRDALDPRLKD